MTYCPPQRPGTVRFVNVYISYTGHQYKGAGYFSSRYGAAKMAESVAQHDVRCVYRLKITWK